MKNTIINQLRTISMILALLGMTLGILFPLNSFQRVSAADKPLQLSETIKPSAEQVEQKLGGIPVYFEENRGQQDKRVKFMTRGGGTQMFLTATEAVYVLRSHDSRVSRVDSLSSRETIDSINSKATAVYMRLAGANEEANFVATEQLQYRTNYFKGAESDWQTEIPNYQRVTAKSIYDGIDMVWHGKEKGGIQYDFVVAPNANPKPISWEIEGASSVSIDADGSLVIETEAGAMKQSKPFTYQETAGVKSEVASQWSVVSSQQMTNNKAQRTFRIEYDLSDYDSSKSLTIDPTVDLSNLAFSTFLGGENSGFSEDKGQAIANDGANNTYVTGFTQSPNFPTTAGSFDTTHNRGRDVFVTKLNATGSSIVYSTFIGGNFDDEGFGIAVDSSGNAFVTGQTQGGTTAIFPTTVGGFDTSPNGLSDVFVTKLNAAGSSLIYSTFIGGVTDDFGQAIAVDSTGNVFVSGYTDNSFSTSTAYPTTAGAFDTTHNGSIDGFVTKLNAAGSSLSYSTFLGGTSRDECYGIAVDSSGNAFVTGLTLSSNYPTTLGVFQRFPNGSDDAFVTKLNATGNSLDYSTYIGGNGNDRGFGIAVDSSGNAFVTGNTDFTNYPTTVGAFDTTQNGLQDGFVTKLNAAGSSLVYSTFLGGSSFDAGLGIALDSSGNAFITGVTLDDVIDYPTTAGAFDTTHNGVYDGFVTKLNAAGSALIYSTFLGGSLIDFGQAIAVDSSGSAFVTGYTSGGSPAFPTTTGAFDTTYNGGNSDVFVTKLGITPNTPTGTNVTVLAPAGLASVTFTQVTSIGDTTFTPINTPSSAGTPPIGYTIIGAGPAYEITTTATYTSPLTVCFTVSSINDAATFSRVRILHGEGGQLIDRTVLAPDIPAPDFASRSVCARVTSLSPFATALIAPPTIANAGITGRVTTANGRPIRNTTLAVSGGNLSEPKFARTNSFGYYRFQDLEVGQTYVVSLAAKRYSFANPMRVITLNEDLTGENFVSDGK
jgi:hypothetical protein